MNRLILIAAAVSLAISHSPAAEVVTSTERQHDILGANSLTLPAPITRWDNAIPLGNGITGGLLWGEGRELRLSLDRGDLWDERGNKDVYDPKRTYATLLKTIADKDRGTWNKYFDAPYTDSPWTKIPGGRLVMTLPDGTTAQSFHLDFEKATASVDLSGEKIAQAFFAATAPVALLRVPKGTTFKFIRPTSIDTLGYPAPQITAEENAISYAQKTTEKLEFSFSVKWQNEGDQLLVAIATATNKKTTNPASAASSLATTALKQGWEKLHAPHLEWWKNLYNASTVSIPVPRLQNHYNLVKYYYGAASRANASPMPLQGVWTADEGSLPPWKGDYHNDLNTQMTYIAWQTAGLTDPGMSYVNYYVDRMSQFRKFGKDFFGLDTAMIPGVMTHDGQAMGGWPQYSMSLTVGIWNGHAFYQQWKTSNDKDFLAKKAYPFLAEITTSALALTTEKDGKFFLKTSSSPEWNDANWNAYLQPNSNFDQALLTWSTAALEEMATALGKTDEAKKWTAIQQKMAALQYSHTTHALLISQGEEFKSSHRHFSHAMAIHPLGILNIEQGETQREAVRATVRQLIDSGSQAWVGYSFTWAASLAARAGFPEDSARLLTDFERAFVTRNGFHVNGDQTKSGLSGFQYRPFTLEGNFLFMDAIHEMYMQSWGGKIRVFPAVAAEWKNCAFTELRAEGGFKVSAKRENGKTTWVKITSLHDGAFQLADPFTSQGKIITKTLQAGESAEFTN